MDVFTSSSHHEIRNVFAVVSILIAIIAAFHSWKENGAVSSLPDMGCKLLTTLLDSCVYSYVSDNMFEAESTRGNSSSRGPQ